MLGYGGGTAVLDAYYGSAKGLFTHRDLECVGTEANIANCPVSTTVGATACTGSEVAGVQCDPPTSNTISPSK